MTIAFELPDQPEVIALIAELDAYQDTLYPPESRHTLDLASLKQANVLFAFAAGCASIRFMQPPAQRLAGGGKDFPCSASTSCVC